MGKAAYVSVTYLFTIEPELVGLTEDCGKKEFQKKVEDYMEAVTDYVAHQTDIFHNDIEISIFGFEKGI